MHTHTHLQETLSFPLGDTVLGYSVLSTVCLPCCWMFCPLSHDLFPLLPLLVFSLVSVSLHFHSVMPCWLSDAVIRNEIQRIPRNLFVTKVLAPKNRAFWLQKNRAEVPRKPWSFSRSWNFFWFEMIWEQMPFWSWNLPGFDAESVESKFPRGTFWNLISRCHNLLKNLKTSLAK